MRISDPGVRIVSVQRHNSDLNSVLTMQTTGCNFQYGPNFGVPLDASFWLWWLFISWKSVFTTCNCIILWKNLQCLSSWNTVRFQQHSEILHPYKFYLICLVGTAFQFVLHIVATEDLCWPGHHNPKAFLSWSRSARVRNLILFWQRVAPICREGFRTLRTFLRLLRKDWGGLQKQLCEKVSTVSKSAALCIDNFPWSFAFESTSGQWTRGTEDWMSAFAKV